MHRLDRLLRPKSVAVVGGGAWCSNVLAQLQKIGFAGDIWPVHPKRTDMGGLPTYAAVSLLPAGPDAVFIGVNRNLTPLIVADLADMGAGGAVCFAAGFQEAAAEDTSGADLQRDLLAAAGDMPIVGPNCYGFINALDGVALWPDQHGCLAVDSGVAIITQSSNIAINLTMQNRGLPLAYVMTAGNQAQIGFADLGIAALEDPRVTALGLHIEGMGDLRALEALAARARALGKPIVALKVGKSDQAQAATISHTASLAGSDAGARALLGRLGIGQVAGLSDMLETLKVLHVCGPLGSNRIASMSCSGGEASLIADTSVGTDLSFPPLNNTQATELRDALGPLVALANPLDYNTYVWGDPAAMGKVYTAMMDPALAMGCIIADFPRADRCDASEWEDIITGVTAARDAKGVPMAIVSSLPETMPEAVAARLVEAGIVPLNGLREAVTAMDVAARLGQGTTGQAPIALPSAPAETITLTEAEAKTALAQFGVSIPKSHPATSPDDAAKKASDIGFPVVLKGEGIAHKTETGAVALNLQDHQSVHKAANQMPAESFLVEQMITDTVLELLVGVVVDPAHGYVLTLAAGGTLTEVMSDSTSLLLPTRERAIEDALQTLKIAPLLAGYRGASAVNMPAIVKNVMALQSYVLDNQSRIAEVEINPLMCGPIHAIAADALIKIGN